MSIIAVIDTSKGPIHLDLFTEECPKTTANFINLATRGYYNELKFHRVLDNFMIQGGCPNGDGRGGPGYNFEDEFNSDLKHDKAGILSMANAGPNTNGSQFFITHVATPWLDGKHTVFGEVKSDSDMEVVNAIDQGDVIHDIKIEGDYEEHLSKIDDVHYWNETLDGI